MIHSYNDHAANERTFLAWLRTGLSAVTLGIVVKKGSLLAAVAGASSPAFTGWLPNDVGNYGAMALVVMGIAVMIAAAIRFVRTALRIDDQGEHSPGIIRLASAFLQREVAASGAVDGASRDDGPAFSRRRSILRRARRLNLRLVGGTHEGEVQAGASQANHPVKG
jgi:putative membrane protein